VLCELEGEFAADFARTQASRFRASTDISVTNSLYHYYALMTGRAVQHESAKVLYVDTTLRSGLAKLPKLLQKRTFDFFCLNDGSFPEVSAQERADVVGEFLQRYFACPRHGARGRRRIKAPGGRGRVGPPVRPDLGQACASCCVLRS